jgi:hypothetical protein
METVKLIVGTCAAEAVIILFAALVSVLMLSTKHYVNRNIPDWLIEEYSMKYGQPIFLILNAILVCNLVWRLFNGSIG